MKFLISILARSFTNRYSVLKPLTLMLALVYSQFVTAATVTFDHSNSAQGSKTIKVKAGEAITFKIENTCTQAFTYEVNGVERDLGGDNSPAKARRSDPPSCDPDFETVKVHDSKFGGYYINVSRTRSATEADKKLANKTFVVFVESSDWNLGFSGGFTLSDLTDPVYGSRGIDDGAGGMKDVIYRDHGAEDSVALGLSGMVHLYHRNVPDWSATFGVSIEEGGDSSYMFGPSYRFSDKGAFNFGLIAGKVSRLPTGLNEGDTLSDANLLSNLGQKTEIGFFISFSYGFVGGIQDVLKKPFMGTPQ